MTAYVALEDLKTYIRNELGAVDDTYLQSCLNAATASINKLCQRTFTVAAATGTARLYIPNGGRTLTIHDAVAVSSVTISGSTIASTLYQLEPVNALSLDGETRPYTHLLRLGGGAWPVADPGLASVTVTGRWGWASTPVAVVEACRILAKDYASQREVRNGLVLMGDYAAAPVQNRTVQHLLRGYRRSESWGIA